MEDKELHEMKIKLDETHRMVSKLYKFEKNRRFWRALKFVLIIVIIAGAYYAVLPIFKNVLDTYNNFSNSVSDIQNFHFPWQNADAEVKPN